MTLKKQALLATAGILFLVLGLNTYINIRASTGKYQEALTAKTAILAAGVKKDIDKALGFGMAVNDLTGMVERLQELAQQDGDIAYALVTDMQGRVLYANERGRVNLVLTDAAAKEALAAAEAVTLTHRDAGGVYYEHVIPLLGLEGRKVGVFRIALKGEAVSRQTRSLLFLSLLVGILSFVIATVFVYLFMEKRIAGPIRSLAAGAGRMAAGDLSQEIVARGRSEIAELAGAVNGMARNLRDMLGRLHQLGDGLAEAIGLIGGATQKMSQGARVQQEATEQAAMTVEEMVASIRNVAENADVMSRATIDASTAVTEMAAAVRETDKSAGVLSSEAEDTASSIAQMLASISEVSNNAEQLASSAEQTTSAITEISASVKEVQERAVDAAGLAAEVSREVAERGIGAAVEAMAGMENIKKSVEEAATTINRLGKRSQEIGQVLKVIDEVAEQTGLLALNAAILASQAGEHGKGFAVVAEEIKELAERTGVSTQEIGGIITAVQRETRESVLAMERGLKAVAGGGELVQVTRDVLEHAAERSSRSSEMARAIERTTAEQARSISQINDAAYSIMSQIEAISRAVQEQRRGSEMIARAAERMRDITRQVKHSTQEQTTGGAQIAGVVESVTGQASQIARATAEQRQGTSQISAAVDSIQRTTRESVDLSIELEIALQTLRERAGALQAELGKFAR